MPNFTKIVIKASEIQPFDSESVFLTIVEKDFVILLLAPLFSQQSGIHLLLVHYHPLHLPLQLIIPPNLTIVL